MRMFLVGGAAFFSLSACASPPRPPAGPPQGARASSLFVPAAADELDVPLPLDARVVQGKLANGVTYYVLSHRKPQKRAQIWLAVNAGSVQEEDDQRGLAHFVEHMSFNGTRRFPKHALVDILEKSGVRLGADLNAHTSFDETVYTLQVPTDNSELVGQAISVLRDWADGVSFDPAEVEQQRKVVLEEWRAGRGAWTRILDKHAPILFHGSKYAERAVIGLPEIIKAAPRDSLVRYYRKWYRPELMAVIAVGDFASTDIVGRFEREFSSPRAPAAPHARPVIALPAHEDKPRVSIQTDPEMPVTSVEIVSALPHRSGTSSRDHRRIFAERLFHSMMNARLEELAHQPDAPFLSASSASRSFIRTSDMFVQQARVKYDGVERGFGALLEEILRVERHGFTASEVDRAKRQILRHYQQEVKERDSRDGKEFATEILHHFLANNAMPDRETKLALVQRFLPTYTLEELNAVGKTLGAGSRTILISGPAKMVKPTAEAIMALSNSAAARDIKPYDDAQPNVAMMAHPPKSGTIVSTSAIANIGVTEWNLSNGVRVIVKPTDFSGDEVRMSAFSPGGTSLIKDGDYDSARFADTIVTEGGLGPFDAVKLRKFLAGKLVFVRPRIGELEEGLSGHASPADLELMFQLIYLSFTQPRRDENAFSMWRAREAETARHRRLLPECRFFEDLQLFTSQNHLRRRPPTPEAIERADLDKAMAIYQDRFADAGDFTFVFVGNVDLQRLKALAETFLGNLPTEGRRENWRDVGVFWPPGLQKKTVVMGREPKSLVTLSFHGDERWSRESENDMRTLVEVMRIRLREVLREKMGGVYGVQVSGGINRRPRQEYVLSVSFACSPENVDKLQQAVFDEAKAIQLRGIDDSYLAKVKEGWRRQHEIDLKDNSFWERELVRAYNFGDDPRLIPDIAPLLEKVTSDGVCAAAKRYMTPRQYVIGVLNPEGAATTATPLMP